MSYRAGKLLSNGRGGHSPAQAHSPRVSACKLAMPHRSRPLWRSPAAVAAAGERPLFPSRPCEELRSLASRELITQVYAAQDLPLREFVSYFNGLTRDNVPPCLTSHEDSGSRMSPTVVQQSVKWDYKQLKRNDHEYNCRCMDCQSARCPVDAALRPADNRNFRFKNNVMTFCDQHTMTRKVNDVACGICLGVSLLQTESKGIETSLVAAKQDERTCPITSRQPCDLSPTCSRIPSIMKRPERHHKTRRDRRKTTVDCDDFGRRMRKCYQEQAVRDTDPADYCYEQQDINVNCRYLSPSEDCEIKRRCSQILSQNQLDSVKVLGRKTLYNEGISDEIANNLPIRGVPNDPSKLLRKQFSIASIELENWIPYSHHGNSRYHEECKKPPAQRYRECAPGDAYRLSEYYHRKYPKKTYYSKCAEPIVYSYATSLPKKVLASEKNIESFILSKRNF